MSKVAVVGSGFIGRAWAITFARAGHEVRALGPGSGRRRPRRSASSRDVLADLAAERPAQRPVRRTRCSPRISERGRPRGGARRRRPCAGERAGRRRDEERRSSPSSTRSPPPETRARQLDLGDPALDLHRGPGRPPAAASSCIRSIRPISSRRSKSCRRPGPIAEVVERAPRDFLRRRRPGADRDEARARRLRHEPHAGRAARRGVPAGRRRLRHASRMSISASATGWRCAGRSWGRSRPSTSTRRAACATMSSAISRSIERSVPADAAPRRLGRRGARQPSSATGARSWPRRISANAPASGATAA